MSLSLFYYIGATIRLTERLTIIDLTLIKSVSLIIIVKSRHDVFLQYIEGKVPSPTPFNPGIRDIIIL